MRIDGDIEGDAPAMAMGWDGGEASWVSRGTATAREMVESRMWGVVGTVRSDDLERPPATSKDLEGPPAAGWLFFVKSITPVDV